MAINLYCQSSLQDHEQVQCGEYNPGGVTQMIVFAPDHAVTDFTDDTQIAAAIAGGKAWHFKDIMVEVPAASPKTVNNPVTGQPTTTNFDRTANITDWNTTALNNNLYNLLNKYVSPDVLFYEILNDGVGRVTHINEDQFGIKFSISRVIPLDNATYQQFEGTMSWTKFDNPEIIAAAPGIFA